MARPTLRDYLTYMGKEPRTKGWGALLVYDREKANRLLMQEHILREEKGAWIEPVSGEKETENGKFTRLSNFTFGAPVLSFENANIGSSMAALTMPVVSGKLTEWSREPGASQASLVGISNLDPLTAPRVKMNIKLNEGAGGVVDKDGRVVLDLSNSTGYYFEVSQWKELNIKLGELIQAKFNDPDRGEQVWELNTLKPVEGALNPTSFRVRTHSLAKAGAAVPSTNQADLEDGAVIVGVAFNGDKNGDFPSADSDMAYLLPSREDGESYSMSVVLNHKTWMEKALVETILKSPGIVPGDLEFKYDANGFAVSAVGGAVELDIDVSRRDENVGDLLYIILAVFMRSSWGVLSYESVAGGLQLRWTVAGTYDAGQVTTFGLGMQWPRVEAIPVDINISAVCNMRVELVDGVLTLKKEEVELTTEFGLNKNADILAKMLLSRMVDTLKANIHDTLEKMLIGIAGNIEVIDLLRLNGLLFRNGQRSVADTLNIPGDVSMLGELAPTLTSFAIDPLDKALVAGGQQKFTLNPKPQEAVSWTVKAADNGATDKTLVGEVIDGLYKAPAADKIPGTFRNVIVTATAGENSSSAQLTIVPKAVAVRPNLLSARFSTKDKPQPYVLEGGGIDAVLEWNKGANFKGELRDPTAAEYDELLIPKDKNCKVYVAPYKPETPGSGQDRLLQLDQVQVSGAGRTENIDVITAWSAMAASLKVKLEAGGALKLTLAVSGWDGEEELPPDQTVWFKVLGSGVIDPATGVYTPGATEGDYVVIAGASKANMTWTYSVLPMPYTEADAQAFAEVNEAFNRLHAARA
ncbi:hypothetical protein ACI2KG_20965 [Pseudomonas sp. NPDC089407]|uniref:hypothetical protein n=1 Tax=Pseudomonas sp. NPDC089407 TaxID=3364464 RepID=UPI003850812E